MQRSNLSPFLVKCTVFTRATVCTRKLKLYCVLNLMKIIMPNISRPVVKNRRRRAVVDDARGQDPASSILGLFGLLSTSQSANQTLANKRIVIFIILKKLIFSYNTVVNTYHRVEGFIVAECSKALDQRRTNHSVQIFFHFVEGMCLQCSFNALIN